MIASERSELFLAVSSTPVPPALDLEELLDKREWESANWSSERRGPMLNQGRRFVGLALEGREIALTTAQEGRLGVDLPAIKAYLLAYEAYRRNRTLLEYRLEEVLELTDSVLEQLVSNPATREQFPPAERVEIARQLFLSLSTVPVEPDE